MRNVRSVFPDQGLIDDYSEMAVKYGNLRREMAIMRANIESVLRHLDDFWTEDKESKAVIVEQLRKALVTNADS